jgi:acetyl-CoA carboxylase carboxyltransferase component
MSRRRSCTRTGVPNLDGASLVTALIRVGGRDVAIYGHDFTVRAGSMDATNGEKLARLFELAAQRRIPLVGLNDSAGAYIPAGVGGLDGYADAFTALRKIIGLSYRASCACSASTPAAVPTCRARAAS